MAAFRGVSAIDLPGGGRSSEEFAGQISGYNAMFGSVSPVIDFEMLAVLKNFWIHNPDFSQYVGNIVNLGNPGHQIIVEAANDARAEAALQRINETAARIYPNACGVDGLVNQYLTSIAWSGAISSEDVVDLAGRRVKKVVIVPVEQIRFKYDRESDEYFPYQRSMSLGGRRGELGMIPLHRETYRYFALSTIENSPYAKPPATAVVDPILKMQRPIMDNIAEIAAKFGLLGLTVASVVPPPRTRGTESDGDYRIRAAKYLKAVKESLTGNVEKGLLVAARDQKIEHTPVSGDAAGVYDLNRISEEQAFSAMHAMPGFHGRTDSTTETFAYVVYNLLVAQVANIQRLVKRRIERTYQLDLALAGVEVDAIRLRFNNPYSLNPKGDAETEQVKVKTVLEKVRAGMITPDQGAQELGYDVWAEPETIFGHAVSRMSDVREQPRVRRSFKFDRSVQRYRYQPDAVEIWSGVRPDGAAEVSKVVPFEKKKALRALD
ncbi:MAG: hypothetical protein IPM50_02665 [Acidobacteriota bacterium]|nr:MAG: hypothetical protein IPM50_02665 [Acidobacteriota bacterium]